MLVHLCDLWLELYAQVGNWISKCQFVHRPAGTHMHTNGQNDAWELQPYQYVWWLWLIASWGYTLSNSKRQTTDFPNLVFLSHKLDRIQPQGSKIFLGHKSETRAVIFSSTDYFLLVMLLRNAMHEWLLYKSNILNSFCSSGSFAVLFLFCWYSFHPLYCNISLLDRYTVDYTKNAQGPSHTS